MWSKIKHKLWQWRGVVISAPSAGILVVALRLTGILQNLELSALDQMFRLRPTEPIDPRVVIVEVNESNVQELGKRGQWPIPDYLLAEIIQNLKAENPSAIGIDFYRDFPVKSGYESLVKVFTTTPNLIGIQKVGENEDSAAIAPPPILKKLDQVGANDFPLDGDGKIRCDFIYLQDKKSGQPIFGLDYRLAYRYLNYGDRKFPDGQTADNLVKIGPVILPLFHGDDGGYIGAEDQGYSVLLNYRGSIQHFPHISVMDVLNKRIPPNLIRGNVVLFGPTAESLKDLFYTPYSSSILKAPKRMAGVTIHANFVSQILSATVNGRPLIKTWSKWEEWLWIFGWSLIGATLIWQKKYTGNSEGSQLVLLLPVISLVAVSYAAFLVGWWIPMVPPLMALIGSALGVTAYVAHTAGEIRKTFGRYLTSEVVANLLEHPEGLKLGGERKKITILTSDLRGFTAVSERLDAEEVVKILNIYLGEMAEVITDYQGTIDEFMGDGILALFGAPITREDDADRAIACAVAMQLALEKVNQKLRQMEIPTVAMGIGINTGEVVVGNIGSEKRTKYGVVGNQINLTYRIESYTVGGQIFASESTIQEVGEKVKIRRDMEVHPKGASHKITIYEVAGIAGKYNLYLPNDEEEIFYNLVDEIPLEYFLVDGKDVSNIPIKGSLFKLSMKGGYIRYDQNITPIILPDLTNIKINFFIVDINKSEDVYGKVLEESTSKDSFYIRFTNIPPSVEIQLDKIRELAK